MTIQKPDSFELFQRYYNGNATKEENELITYWIHKDQDFKQLLDEYQTLFSGLSHLRVIELEKQLSQFSSSDSNTLDLDKVEEIERYFNEQLTEDELKAFEYRLHTNPEFKQQVKEYQSIFEGLNKLRVNELEKKLTAASTEISTETETPQINSQPKQKTSKIEPTASVPKTGMIRRLVPLVAAAAAAVLLWFGLPLLMESDSAKFQRLQAEYATSPRIENLMSAGTKDEEIMKEGKNAFLTKDFKKAVAIFNKIVGDDEAALYLGHSLFESGEYSKAENVYATLQAAPNTDISNEADWYLAQCYLKDLPKQKEKLLVVLNKITNSKKTHNYRKKAGELSKEF